MANLIYLDVDDEITSAAARIRAAEVIRIGLVLPLGSRLATSRINFRLLAREAEARGKQLEIVTNDASARALAASAGLVTHVSVAAFEGGPVIAGIGAASVRTAGSEPPRKLPDSLADSPTVALPAIRPPAPVAPVPEVGRRTGAAAGGFSSRRLAALLAVVVVLLGAGTVGFLTLPSAEITLTPANDRIGPLHLNITAQSGITKPDPANLLVPATEFKFDVQASDTFPATDVKVAETSAAGEVTFENCDTGGAVTIPQGSVVSTADAIRFQTLAKVALKRARIFPFACEAGTVGVAAVAPGLTGNVAAGAVNRVPTGFDPVVLRVSNVVATTGGTHTETKQVAQKDVDAALAALKVRLASAFDASLAAATGIPAGTTVFAETKALGDPAFTPDPTKLAGTVADTFQLGASATGTVVGVDPAPVSVLADARLRTAVGDGYTLVEGSIDLQVGTPIVNGASITFPVTVKATRLRQLDPASLRARIRGLGVPQARSLLGEYGDVTITVWPDWVTTIPTNDGRVTFTVVAASPGASAGSSASPGTTAGTSP